MATTSEILLPDPQDIRTEYSALSSYHHTLVTFRFTLLGFYLTATGLIVSSGLSKEKSALLLGVSVGLWLIELRNRALLVSLLDRGTQIEREFWGYRGKRAYEPLYSRLSKSKPEDDAEAGNPPPADYTRVWNRVVKIDAHYTQALDLIFLMITLYAILQLF